MDGVQEDSPTEPTCQTPKPEPETAAARPRLTERRASIVLALGVVTLLAGIGLVVASQLGGSSSGTKTVVPGAEQVAALLAGIPQNGTVLGSPEAPVTLVE